MTRTGRSGNSRGGVFAAAVALAMLAASPQAGLAQGTVKIGMPTAPPNIVHMPVYIAADLGYFKDEGLTPEFLSFEGGVYAFRAAVSGSVDTASASGPYSIVGRAQGAKTKLVLANAPKLEATMTVQGSIKTLQDLKGKRIGIQEPGGFADVLSKMVLRSGNVKPDEVHFVSILSEDVPPLVAGQIDTAILHVEQFLVAKSKKQDLHVLAKLWEVAPLNLYNAFVVKEEMIAKRRKDVIGMTRAIIRGTRIMYSDRQKVMPSLVKHTGLDEKILSPAYDELVASCVWDANHGLSKERVNSTAQLMKKVGNIKGDVPSYEDLVDLTIPEAALQTLGPWRGPVCAS
jgi:ABC-type nitrate/sulfonate/bicarbonate transport system substrate-binding protein